MCVVNSLNNDTYSTSKEEKLYAVTSDVIYRIMELLDGYSDICRRKMDVTDLSSGESLKTEPRIELHDVVHEYIKE